jgi:hypothetical protein
MYMRKGRRRKVDSEHLSGSRVQKVALLAPPDPSASPVRMYMGRRRRRRVWTLSASQVHMYMGWHSLHLPTLSTSLVRMYLSYVHGAALLAPPNSERLSGSHVHAKGKKKKLMGGSTHVR